MNILVTGATGFVGYHVARKLSENSQNKVRCLARPSSEKRFLQKLAVTIADGDLRDKTSLEKAMDGCETLYHVAADYRLWSKNPQELIDSNVQGTDNILSAALKIGVQKVIYTSSVSAVGRPEPQTPIGNYENLSETARAQWEHNFAGNENMRPSEHQLIGPYKKSKFLAEQVARRYAQQGLNLVIVNPSTPVGSHDVKPTPTGKLVLDFLNRKMPAYLDTGLNLVDVEDVADGHLLAAQKGEKGERYILGNKNLMLKEILLILSTITGLPAPKLKIPYPIAYAAGWVSTAISDLTGQEPAVPLDGVKMAREIMFYDGSKAVKELGIPQTPVEQALEKSVRFFKDNGYVH